MTGTPRRRAVLTALGASVAAAVTTGGLAYAEDGADPSGRVPPDLHLVGAFYRHLARLAITTGFGPGPGSFRGRTEAEVAC